MNICICTTPIRPVPTRFPPFGSLAIIQSMRQVGVQARFFNIDYFRYSHEQIEAHFRDNQFDVVGISAVVSTAYSFTKYLTGLIRRVSPRTLIVLGGNLAASAEILLRKCHVDVCVIGDGELIIRDLIPVLRERPLNHAALKATKGIAFLNENGEFHFTGYGAKPAADEIEAPDYGILEADGSLPYFISQIAGIDGQADFDIKGYNRPIAHGETMATVVMTKGCVARCTFCHRWERGFRAKPVDQVIDHVRFLRDTYKVRFINVADENFGSDRKLAHELAIQLGELDVAWMVAGVRTRTIRPNTLKHWKANGCLHVYFGIESGSQTMLDVMEKNATVENNVNALKWTYEAGLGTIIQLVIGMPGETDQTIHETIDFLKRVSAYQLYWEEELPSGIISINYAQALPGTPLYEYARQHGFIGRSIDEEERYLERISDTDAYKEDHFINYTGQPMLKVLMWRPLILAHIDAHHLQRTRNASMTVGQVAWYYLRALSLRIERRLGLAARFKALLGGSREAAEPAAGKHYDHVTDSGYFNIHKGFKFAPLLLNPLTRRCFYPLLALAVAVGKSKSLLEAVALLGEHLLWSATRPFRPAPDLPKRSLRKIVKIEPATTASGQDMMIPLRSGR
jgi:radical SAM superfamily enzyme YgiQ (UPF0313 family)